MTEAQAIKARDAMLDGFEHAVLMAAFNGSERGIMEMNDMVERLKDAAKPLGYKLVKTRA